MSNKEDGGAAFPNNELTDRNGDIVLYAEQGMTLRDYFAAKALPGLLCTCEREPGGAVSSLSAEALARASYEMADAMLKERNK